MNYFCCIVLLVLSVFGSEAYGESFRQIAEIYGISPILLEKLAKVESDHNPYALHLQSRRPIDEYLQQSRVKYKHYEENGKHHYQIWPSEKRQAEWIVQYILPMCVKYDVGLFQISNAKMQDFELKPIHFLDPIYSAHWASKILRDCYDKEGSLWTTIECYHRGSSKGRLTSYSQRVYQQYRQSAFSAHR